jgi:hypothetical protein
MVARCVCRPWYGAGEQPIRSALGTGTALPGDALEFDPGAVQAAIDGATVADWHKFDRPGAYERAPSLCTVRNCRKSPVSL